MKTTSIGAKMARTFNSGIGAVIAGLAMSRGLANAAQLAEMGFSDREHGRPRYPGPRRPTGAKLRRAAHNGNLTVRHKSSTDQYWRDVYAKRILAARDRRLARAG